MNTLELFWQVDTTQSERGLPAPRLQVLIDGRLLTDIISEFEIQHGYAPFNDAFLLPDDVAWYSRESWQRSSVSGAARVVLLGCTCGDVDCSNFYADTYCQNGWIHWHFGGWPERDYKLLGKYWFEQQAYQQQVNAVMQRFTSS